MIDRLQGFYGFTRMPFGRDLAPGMLHRHAAHGEAVARIGWCVTEQPHRRDHRRGRRRQNRRDPRRPRRPRRHPAHHHLPTQPHRRRARHPPPDRRRPRQATPAPLTPPSSPKPPTHWPPNTPNAAASPSWSSTRPTSSTTPNSNRSACSPTTTWTPPPVRLPARRATHPAPTDETRRPRRPRPAHRLRYAMPPMTSQETASYLRHHLALAGRSDTLFSDDAITLIHQTSRGYPRAVNNLAVQALARRLRRRQDHRRRILRSRRRRRGHGRMKPRRHPEHQAPPAPTRRGCHSQNTLTSNDAHTLTTNDAQQASVQAPVRRSQFGGTVDLTVFPARSRRA